MEIRSSVDELVLYLFGMVVLNSGVAASLDLSPLFVNAVFGITVANLSLRVEEIFRQIAPLERPLFITLLILAGARWQFLSIWLVLPLLIAYVGIRFMGKWLGCLAGRRLFQLADTTSGRLGMGLVAQGGQALAVLIDLVLAETTRPEPLVSRQAIMLLETVVILAIIANEFAAPMIVRHVLAHGGEPERAP
jgi:Kef-type K+ transport system membrane component KefB